MDDTPESVRIPAAASAVGSMPGSSPRAAAEIIAGELAKLPHVAELPARGPGSDMIGRTVGLLSRVSVEFGAETVPTGWRIAGSITREMRRAWSWLGEDLDATEEFLSEAPGWCKLQVCGPWTLAASLEAPRGGVALRDPGLVAALGEALAVAVAAHAADLGRRLPGRTIVVQVDEPSLPAVLDGRIQTASGFGTLPGVTPGEAAALLRPLPGDHPGILHCCAAYPFGVARTAGFAGCSFDLRQPVDPDDVAETFEAGMRLLVGAVRADPDGPGGVEENWGRLSELWQRTGLGAAAFADIAVTPACGLAGTSEDGMRRTLEQVGQLLQRARSAS